MHRQLIEDYSRHVFALVVLCLVIYFPYLGARDFWDVETHFAEVIRVMALKGNYFLPTMNGQLWTENPPLYFWIAVLFSWLFGSVSEFTIRLPSALSATEVILLYYLFLRKRFDARLAFLSTIVLATSVLTVHVERHVPINMTFYLFVILAVFLVMEVVVFDSVRLRDAYGVWFFIALACLTNGVAGLAIPAAIVFPYVLIQRCWKRALALRPVTGSLLFLAIIGIWVACVAWQKPDGWREVVFSQLRLLHHTDHTSVDHQFFFQFPLAFTPWAFLLVPAVISLWPKRSGIWEKPVLFMLIWFLSTLVFAESFLGYHSHYVFLTGFPAALLIGAYLDNLFSTADARVGVWTHRFVLLLVFILVVAGITGPPIIFSRSPVLLIPALALAITAIVFSACFYFAAKRSNYVALICGFTILPVIVNIVLQGLLFPSLNALHGRGFAEQLGTLGRGQTEVPIVLAASTRVNFFNYYSGIDRFETMEKGEDMIRFLSRREGPIYILGREGKLSDLKELLRGDFSVVLTGTTVRGNWTVLSPCVDGCNAIPLLAERSNTKN